MFLLPNIIVGGVVMSLCRCLAKHAWPQGTKSDYVGYVTPVGYPQTALICGLKECDKPAVIWLTQEEVKKYQEGGRIFGLKTALVKVKADDNGINLRK